ncbi:hypothetical protein DJ93_5364 [Bacillus clarus]|uniref:Uncharacterized protein n=1 Tax=Bacillus clarus TaxID=2338372 RepID=A0A090YZ61_9BACI|nr:hypothetical protein DJ93_5364 [Bacillus clarus]
MEEVIKNIELFGSEIGYYLKELRIQMYLQNRSLHIKLHNSTYLQHFLPLHYYHMYE